jgi:hypothetical protein
VRHFFTKRAYISSMVAGTALTMGVLYYEYSQPPIRFKRDANGNVSVPANVKPEELFVNPAAGDFRLKPENPAVRGGVPLPEVLTDINGNPRDPQHPSLGAVEFQGTPNTSGGSASKFFSAPFTYFVLLTTLLANMGSLYMSAKIFKESSRNQVALIGLFREHVLRRTKSQRRTHSRFLNAAAPAQEMLEELKESKKITMNNERLDKQQAKTGGIS